VMQGFFLVQESDAGCAKYKADGCASDEPSDTDNGLCVTMISIHTN
jgi:hypothetical protein